MLRCQPFVILLHICYSLLSFCYTQCVELLRSYLSLSLQLLHSHKSFFLLLIICSRSVASTKTNTFVLLFFLTLLLQSTRSSSDQQNDAAIYVCVCVYPCTKRHTHTNTHARAPSMKVHTFSELAQVASVELQVVSNKCGDEKVAVIVSFLHAQSDWVVAAAQAHAVMRRVQEKASSRGKSEQNLLAASTNACGFKSARNLSSLPCRSRNKDQSAEDYDNSYRTHLVNQNL